jgi:hypothetical protein
MMDRWWRTSGRRSSRPSSHSRRRGRLSVTTRTTTSYIGSHWRRRHDKLGGRLLLFNGQGFVQCVIVLDSCRRKRPHQFHITTSSTRVFPTPFFIVVRGRSKRDAVDCETQIVSRAIAITKQRRKHHDTTCMIQVHSSTPAVFCIPLTFQNASQTPRPAGWMFLND